jgi:hypothetical protein
MGTDIYLSWDGQTKEDEDLQSTGFDITQGEVGYLRAAVWMSEENNVLRALFPNEYWEAPEAMEYDFDMNVEVLKKFAQEYAIGNTAKPSTILETKTKEALQEALEGLGTVQFGGENLSADDKTKWLRSLVAFFKKGWQLQKDGKKPKIYISW